jgi:HPt (histidine-containing phosphotransfer) domain-containing protein
MTTSASDPEPLDRAMLNQLRQANVPGEPDVALELINLFLIESPPLVAQIQAAAQADDPAALRHAAHTLKGSAAGLGARPLAAANLKSAISNLQCPSIISSPPD